MEWTEKYRPLKLSDFCGMKNTITAIRNIINSGNVPHMIFFGDVGTGKTSMAHAIANEAFGDGSIGIAELNASKYNGLNLGNIYEYARNSPWYSCFITIPFKGEPFKILLLDEADGMSDKMQANLKRPMEEFGYNCKFILTCNNLKKIIKPIRSRCKMFHFIKPTNEELYLHLKMIARKENAKINDDVIRSIAETSNGDVRHAIINLQCACK